MRSPRGRSAAATAAAALVVLALLAPRALGAAGDPPAAPGYLGKSLTEALLDLGSRGLQIVFTDQLVRPEMRVEAEPTAVEPRRILDQLLAPHGLAARDGPGGTLVVVPAVSAAGQKETAIQGILRSLRDAAPIAKGTVRVVESGRQAASDAAGGFRIEAPGTGTFTLEAEARGFLRGRLERVAVGPGQEVEVEILLEPAAVIEERMVVTPSRVSLLLEEPTGPLGLSREEILNLPHLGDDFFRAVTLLPGATANDVSAQFHVRGGRRDETVILIDGQELYEAFHLKDFDSALSFVAPGTLGSAELTTGGFPVAYGDRMSGVLEMTTVQPTGPARFRLGAGVLTAHAGGAGRFDGGRASWLAEARRGATDLVGRLLGDEDPQYWDAFAKLDYGFGRRHRLRLNLLYSADELDFQETVDGDTKNLETEYENSYLWLTHQAFVGDDLFFETAASVARIERDRRGLELEEDARFNVRDARESEILALRQRWTRALGEDHSIEWGWQWRDFDTDYDYLSTHLFDNPLAVIRHDGPENTIFFRRRLLEDHGSAHAAVRVRVLEPLTLELGLRYDRHSQTDESLVSPRLNLAWAVGDSTVLRLAWGRFNQSQRPYELQVEDGETRFHSVERSEHRVVAFERLFAGGARFGGLVLRAEAYRRSVSNPRPRYENLYEAFNNFPELEPDRVRIRPERSVAQGIEVFLRGRFGERLGWWANYAWASTEDRIGGVWAPRIFDQTHSLNLDLDWRLAADWRLNLAWRYHTGWPTTPLSLRQVRIEDPEGEVQEVFVPVLGPLNSRRLSSYHRLDLRASRRWRPRKLAVEAFVDLQNVYDRRNLAGFDIEIDEDTGELFFSPEQWTGFLPSAGVSVTF